MLALDGSTLEGGGQLVRVALSVSAICGASVLVTNIRANRAAGSARHKSRGGHHGDRAGRGHGRGSQEGSTAVGKSAGGGLKESHLAALNWLAKECDAAVEGAEVGSREVVFRPGRREGTTKTAPGSKDDAAAGATKAEKEADVIALKNPGSVWLVWQAIFPYIVFSMLGNGPENARASDTANSSEPRPALRIILKGGTNVPKSPSGEYMQQVFLPLCERIGLPRVDVRTVKRGWAGSAPEIGEVAISVFAPPTVLGDGARCDAGVGAKDKEKGVSRGSYRLPPFHVSRRGDVTGIALTILAGSSATHSLLESSLIASLRSAPLFSSPSLPITLHPSSDRSGDERRLYVLLVAHTAAGHTLGRDCLGSGRKITSEVERRRIVAEVVGHVVRDFVRECEKLGGVDEFAEDQLVVFQALAEGVSSVDAGRGKGNGEQNGENGSLHTRTVRWVCEEMLGTVFDGVGGCEGAALVRREDQVEVNEISRAFERGDIDDDDEEEQEGKGEKYLH